MQKKTTPPMQVLYYSVQATFANLSEVGKQIAALYEDAVKSGLFISGPVQWIYLGADGKPDTVFTIDVALPVQGKPSSTPKFQVKTLAPLTCYSVLHDGDWKELHQVYDKNIDWIYSQGMKLAPQNECREIYLNMDFENVANNRTEVLLGISE